MRRRLMVSILLLVAGTLVLAGVGSILLIRRTAISTAQQQLLSEARAVAAVKNRSLGLLVQLRKVEPIGQYQFLGLVGVSPDGALSHPLPARLQGASLETTDLVAGQPLSGHLGRLVYTLVPLHLTGAERLRLARSRSPIPLGDQAVVVATRNTPLPLDGFFYYVLVALGALAVAAGVAYWLANRFSLPLRRAADTTAQIAGGDLEARMASGPGDMAEFASLATAINAMGVSLERARHQQRQFLLSVSHDLRTPLTSIRGYAEAVADGTTTDVAGAVAVITAESRRLERLVQDLLDLARLDAQRFSLRAEGVDVGDVVASTVDSFRPGAAAASLTLTEDLPGQGSLLVVTDPDRLAQLLSNLVENAFRFARTSVVVGARRDAAAVLLWVLDDGKGIAPEDLPRVFEPHFTSDGAASHRSGTGLGLAIVAELAAAMGGGVRAESPLGPGGGTAMTVWLPATTAAPAHGAPVRA